MADPKTPTELELKMADDRRVQQFRREHPELKKPLTWDDAINTAISVANAVHDEIFADVMGRSGNKGVAVMRAKPCLTVADRLKALLRDARANTP